MRLKSHSGRALSLQTPVSLQQMIISLGFLLYGYLISTSQAAKRKPNHWQNVFKRQSRSPNFTSNPNYVEGEVENLISTEGTEICRLSWRVM